MKRILLPIALMLITFSGCQDEESTLPPSRLSEQELETLLFTREEEKLAFDVYNYAFEKHGLPAFQNIASSEQQHINAVLSVMASNGIADPLNGTTDRGIFSNPTLQDLYSLLTARVNQSLQESIKVGLLIEDMDINDLKAGILETSNPQLIQVYSSLKCGSENHLRSFFNQAQIQGVDYSPEFTSQEEYTQIVNSPRTSCQTTN
ncbi:DUF2202 domain-containing protein [Algoriphagus taiwanensis]